MSLTLLQQPRIAPTGAAPLIDRYGRQITYLRISVTDRCDFRCTYCMSEHMTFLPRKEVLSFEEIDQIASAFDDNERSSWSGGGSDGSAWAEFTLACTARLTELTACFPNWRSRTYPILVTVDGQEAYRGVTPTSLGYVTLPRLVGVTPR